MGKAYFVLNTERNNKYYPVICPVEYGEDEVFTKLNMWIGNYEIRSVFVYNTKKKANEFCQYLRDLYREKGELSELLE